MSSTKGTSLMRPLNTSHCANWVLVHAVIRGPSAAIDHLDSGEVAQSIRRDGESSQSHLAPICESQQEDIPRLHWTRNTTGRPNLDRRLLRTKQPAAKLGENGPARIREPGFVPRVQVATGIDHGDRAV